MDFKKKLICLIKKNERRNNTIIYNDELFSSVFYIMPRFEKGSKEALEWGQKMKQIRDDKKLKTGGNIKKMTKAFNKFGSQLNNGFGKAAEVLNPMEHALKNKDTRSAMIASGDATHDYILPSVVAAGKPLLYGMASTVGGPVGVFAIDALYNNMVTKPGYDPQRNQKSAILGTVSSKMGEVGASRLGAKFKS